MRITTGITAATVAALVALAGCTSQDAESDEPNPYAEVTGETEVGQVRAAVCSQLTSLDESAEPWLRNRLEREAEQGQGQTVSAVRLVCPEHEAMLDDVLADLTS